ncbi:serine/threonine protein kinase [Coemansia biformis]|uniref:Serine/threonine protein kinase n=1 Tax=Coemansia biformis TaxID=1286918 RepID=A0A9W7YGT6_9FUNG|nr:serine/threonine protein kinase [Coemansia biformis]
MLPMDSKATLVTESQEMDVLNQLFQRQLLVNQVPRSVWGVLLSLSPDDYKTVLLERTKPLVPQPAGASSSPSRSTAKFGYHIGRHKSCDIRIQNVHISNRHCLIYRVEDGDGGAGEDEDGGGECECEGAGAGATGRSRVYLEDTSTNGTFVNGRRVGKSASVELCDGDEIQLVRYQPGKGMSYFNDRFYVFQNLDLHRREPCLFKQSYLLADHLGKGAFAHVRVAINRVTGERFAAKIIDRNRIPQLEKRRKLDENFRVETSILSRVRHPSIVQVHGVFRESDRLYLVLDLAAGGELFDEIVHRQCLSEDDSRRVLLQLLLAIRHLHRMGIVHRDIKLENILLADKAALRLKLADFGLAKIVGEQMFMKTVCGTPMYVAPEVLTVRQAGVYDNLVDVWSLGVVLYICLCGFPPFSDELAPPPMRDQIIAGMYSFPSPYWDTVSPEAIDLVCQMLQADPRSRITVDAALAHPWLRACCTPSGWTIAGTGFVVVDPDYSADSQHTQCLTTDSSQQQVLSPMQPPSMLIPLRSAPLPPSSPPVIVTAPVYDPEIALGPTSASGGEAQTYAARTHCYGEAGSASHAGPLSGASPTADTSRKRKDPSFMRSQSDLGEMALPKRAMHGGPEPAPLHRPGHASASPSLRQGSTGSGPLALFEMSPDVNYQRAEDYGNGDGRGPRPRPSDGAANYACPLLIYPKAIPRPGAVVAAAATAAAGLVGCHVPAAGAKGGVLSPKTVPEGSGQGRRSGGGRRPLPTFFDLNGRP